MAKGSKVGALDEVYQYVKNKLPQTGFFSTLDELIANAPFEQAPIEEWRNYLKPGRIFEREGVRFPLKQEELDYAGLNDEFSGLGAGAIPKDSLRRALQARRPSIDLQVGLEGKERPGKTVLLRDTDLERFPLESEIERKGYITGEGATRDVPRVQDARYGEWAHDHTPGTYEESATRSADFGLAPKGQHFGSDVISHSRTTIQPTVDQRLMRLVEEIQSDRHQRAAERIYADPDDESADLSIRSLFRNAEKEDPNELEAASLRLAEIEGRKKRRGYRTKEDEDRLQEIEEALDDRDVAGYQGELSEEPYRQLSKEQGMLRSKVPDTPFRNPADYGLLELKQQMLNAAKADQDYLGIISGKDVSDRFGHAPSEASGTSHIYDKVYPAQLEKLARQYGAEVQPVESSVKSARDARPEMMVDLDAEDIPRLIETSMTDHPDPALALRLALGGTLDEIWEEIGDTATPALRERYARSQENIQKAADHLDANSDADISSITMRLEDDMGVLLNAYRGQDRFVETKKPFTSMVLTPEVRERIKKAGVPIWALTGASLAGLGANEEPEGFAEGGGVERARDLADEFAGQDENGAERNRRMLAGLMSQVYGMNEVSGEPEFLGGDYAQFLVPDSILRSYRRMRGEPESQSAGPGLIDEIRSMMLGTKKAEEAEERLIRLREKLREKMGLEEAEGFQENFDESLGVMLGQLPVPVKGAVSAAKMLPGTVKQLSLMDRLKKLGKGVADPAAEWFFPTVSPSPKNYLTGATFGGALGAIGDSIEKEEEYAKGGKVKNAKRISEWMKLVMKDKVPRSHDYDIENSPEYYDILAESRWDPLVSSDEFELMEASHHPYENIRDPVPWMDWTSINSDLERLIEKYGIDLPDSTRLFRGLNVAPPSAKVGEEVLRGIAPQSTSLDPRIASMYTRGSETPLLLDALTEKKVRGLPRVFLSQDEFMLPTEARFIKEFEEEDPYTGLRLIGSKIPGFAKGGQVEGVAPLREMLEILKGRMEQLNSGMPGMSPPGDNSAPTEDPMKKINGYAKGGRVRSLTKLLDRLTERVKDGSKLDRMLGENIRRRFPAKPEDTFEFDPETGEIISPRTGHAEGGKVKTLLDLREALMRKLESPNVEGTGRELVAPERPAANIAPRATELTPPEELMKLVNQGPGVPSVPLQMSRRNFLQGAASLMSPVDIDPRSLLMKQLTDTSEYEFGVGPKNIPQKPYQTPTLEGSDEAIDFLQDAHDYWYEMSDEPDYETVFSALESLPGTEGLLAKMRAYQKSAYDWDTKTYKKAVEEIDREFDAIKARNNFEPEDSEEYLDDLDAHELSKDVHLHRAIEILNTGEHDEARQYLIDQWAQGKIPQKKFEILEEQLEELIEGEIDGAIENE